VAGELLFRCAIEQTRRNDMSLIPIFTPKWNKCYRILRYSKGFGLFDSLRYGLWLARG